MAPVVLRITERNLDDAFARAPYLLAAVERVPSAPLPKGLPAYLDQRYPERFTFGTFWRGEWSAERLAHVLQTSLGPLRAGVKDGLYLCEAGFVIGHHVGQLRPASASWAADGDERAARERVTASAAARGLSAVDLERLCQLVGYFEPILERRQRPVEPEPQAWTSREPAAPSPAPVSGEPYAVLGVSPSATDEEVRAAYKNALKLNHPDKVAHLSPALQRFAQQETLKVLAAWEAIAGRRGLR